MILLETVRKVRLVPKPISLTSKLRREVMGRDAWPSILFSCLATLRVRCPARKIAQLHCRFILPKTAIAVYAPLFRMSTSSQLSRYLCSFQRGCGKHRPICNELALEGSEGLDGMKVHDCMLQKFFRLRDRLCRLRALRSHEIRLHLYPP